MTETSAIHSSSIHVSVLPREVSEYLRFETAGTFLDCTLGGGGHTAMMLQGNPASTVLAIDRDEHAIRRGTERFANEGSRIRIEHGSFADLSEICGEQRFNGILADLGVSTDQLKERRGFSFFDESPLDMRMDPSQAVSAYTVVNEYSERELFEVLKRGGVGAEARGVVKSILRSRPLSSTKALADIIDQAVPAKFKKARFHAATVPFQAIRIEVNQELAQIEALLFKAPELVASSGRLAVIAFHSGEDRVVTQTMRRWEQGEQLPALWRGNRSAPKVTVPGEKLTRSDRIAAGMKVGTVLTRKAVQPQEDEVEGNSSARSSRLRVFEFD